MDEGIDPREQALIQIGVEVGQRYAEEHLSGKVRRTVTVHIANEGVCIDGANAIGYRICVNAASESWRSLSPEWRKVKIAAHEYFHVWQTDLFCYGEPKWLFEGLAEWFGYKVVEEAGMVDEVVASVARQQLLQEHPIEEPLAEQERLYAAPAPEQYALWSFAASLLMTGHDGEDLRTFCAGQAEGLSWQESFEAAFGEPVETFYAEFEEWRAGFLG